MQFDNRPGASGAIGLAQFVNSSKGDPNALLIGGMAMLGGVIQTRSAVTLSQVTPLARLASEHEVILVAANGPSTLKELLDTFKANPAGVSWGGGSTGNVLVRLIAKELGVEPVKVSYAAFKGRGEVVPAILGRRVTAGVVGLSDFARRMKSADVRALAISSPRTSAGIPSLKEQGVNVQLANWYGVFAAPGITKAQRDEFIRAIETATRSKEWQESLKENDREPSLLSGEAYGAFLEAENKRLADVLSP
jgi:putative tricarboxylic transport membrane protein